MKNWYDGTSLGQLKRILKKNIYGLNRAQFTGPRPGLSLFSGVLKSSYKNQPRDSLGYWIEV